MPGVILNFVDTSLPEYYYYQYSEYYNTPVVPGEGEAMRAFAPRRTKRSYSRLKRGLATPFPRDTPLGRKRRIDIVLPGRRFANDAWHFNSSLQC